MTLALQTFKLYEDSGLTILFSGTLVLAQATDFSDNPRTKQFWYGSNTASRTLGATSNLGVDQITLTPTDLTPRWAASTAYTTANAVEPLIVNTYWYTCVTAGTSGSSAPAWPTSGIGSTVVDGTVLWQLMGKTHPVTEMSLALTSGGLAGATPGAALNIGNTILSGVSNAATFWVQIVNTVSTPSNDVSWPQIGFNVNGVTEY